MSNSELTYAILGLAALATIMLVPVGWQEPVSREANQVIVVAQAGRICTNGACR
jgi:hypothetical protein